MVAITWRVGPTHFVVLLAVLLIQGLLPLAGAWITKLLFDLLSQSLYHHAEPNITQHLSLLLVAQACLIVVSQLISPANQYFNAELGYRLSLHIKTGIYQKLNSFIGLTPFEDPHLHNTIQVVSNSAQSNPVQVLTSVATLFQGIITVTTFLGVLIAFNPLLALVVGGVVLPYLYIQLRLSRKRFSLAFTNSPKERLALYYGQVLSWLSHAKEVRLFNLGDYFLSAFVQVTREIQQAKRVQQKVDLRWRLPLALLTSAITTGAFIAVMLQAFSGRISLGDITLYTNAVTSIQSSLLSITLAISQLNESTLYFREYANLLALPEKDKKLTPVRSVPMLAFGITLSNVSFRYGEHQPWALHHIDLFLPAGKCLALVGLNGAGKTTLVKLLTRLYEPTEGQILWDGIDIREFDPRELRRHIGAIFQDFVHYDLTAQHNIGLGNIAEIETNETVYRASMRAGIHERIIALPQGYQNYLGRWLATDGTGVDLSGGEWQKIALARMFMRESELLILDEPTASLDAQAEYDLYTHFRDLMQGRTSLLITHRFSTVRMADSIAVIEHGQLIEYGTHEDLLKQGGSYARLYTMQEEQYH
jgi:ATP-binding cassette subfamily B protein